MTIEYFVIIACLILIIFLISKLKSKNEDYNWLAGHHGDEAMKHSKEVEQLKKNCAIETEKLNTTIKKKESSLLHLRGELNTQTKRIEDIRQNYFKLLRAYMIARRKDEVSIIEEIEASIAEDYEELGSKGVYATEYISSAMADYYTSSIKDAERELRWRNQIYRSEKIADVRAQSADLVSRAKLMQYTYELMLIEILKNNPQIDASVLSEKYGVSYEKAIRLGMGIEKSSSLANEMEKLKLQCDTLNNRVLSAERRCEYLKTVIAEYETMKDQRWPMLKESIEEYVNEYGSNLSAIPYMSGIVADIMTVDLDKLAWSLSWGNNKERKRKVASINELKKQKKEQIEKLKWAEYQLAYLLELYPVLQEVIETEFSELDITNEEIIDYDPVKKFIAVEEWRALSETERNQLALDRYIESRSKSKWQIGRDYELYCGYCFNQQGFIVDYFGSYKGLEDLGRDLIVYRLGQQYVVQCKYWSQNKKIHEKHIMQLYGSVIEYNMTNYADAKGILMTNTQLTDKAKAFAKALGIMYVEMYPMGEFPRIKCNIGRDSEGKISKIYHLPFDQQYDATKIEKTEEFMAMTVREAEEAGFRRAYKWKKTR